MNNGASLKILTLNDEYLSQWLKTEVDRKLRSSSVLDALAEVMDWRSMPEYLRSGNGPGFMDLEVKQWIGELASVQSILAG